MPGDKDLSKPLFILCCFNLSSWVWVIGQSTTHPAQWNLSHSHSHTDALSHSPSHLAVIHCNGFFFFTPVLTGLNSESNNLSPERLTKQHFSKRAPVFLFRSMTTGWRKCTWTTGWPYQSTPVLSWCFLSRRSEIIKMPSGMCLTLASAVFQTIQCLHVTSFLTLSTLFR